tara:strand:+ start:1327 stop:1455 length:129 start_codon:yes stop_codon:yes gene_type:complete
MYTEKLEERLERLVKHYNDKTNGLNKCFLAQQIELIKEELKN